MRIVILGYIVRRPFGGQAWHYLQYAMGLARLGHEVYYVEDSGDFPDCLNPLNGAYGWDAAFGLQFLADILNRIGLGEHWTYYDAPVNAWYGPCRENILQIARTSDVALNVSGLTPVRDWLMEIPRRVLIDTDPGFTQIFHLTDQGDSNTSTLWGHTNVEKHTHFFTFGENINHANCGIPRDGFPWQPTRQPVVLDAWPVTPGPASGKFTTVMSWRTYRAIKYNGIRFGIKSDSFAEYLDLPQRTNSILELTVTGYKMPRALLSQKGWHLCSPIEETNDPWNYQRYIQRSKAEFSVAKEAYVTTRSGWFSERSTAYLASGRPVVVQDTGFSDWLPTGTGVVAFNTPDEALAGIESINSRYEFHCKAARDIAEEYFDARKELARLMERAVDNV